MHFPNTEKGQALFGAAITLLVEELTEATQGNLVIGVTSGCFDILHPLHVQYLEKCKANCDILLVAVDSDSLIYNNKGRYPILSENDRAYMVGALDAVEVTFIIDTLEALQTNLQGIVEVTNGGAEVRLYKAKKEYYGKPVIEVPGVEIVEVPDVYPANSTTELVKFIQNGYKKL